MIDRLNKVLLEENIACDSEKLSKLVSFAELLKEWNQKMNLTAIENDDDIIYKHFLDSLLVLKIWDKWDNKKVIDIGTGAGFPGIPLKIFEPTIKIDLLDSLNKRLIFLENVTNSLNLSDVNLIHGRAEDYGKDEDYREKYDIALARAVAKLPILLEFCLPFVKVGGYFIALKGLEAEEELAESHKALEVLGAKFIDSKSFTLLNGEHKRTLMLFEKIAEMPSKYPRKAGIPKKRPLIK